MITSLLCLPVIAMLPVVLGSVTVPCEVGTVRVNVMFALSQSSERGHVFARGTYSRRARI